MSSVETLSPRTIRARSIQKDLSGEQLRALAKSGEQTTEYGSPVYATRIKSRSAKKTYIVADGVTVGVMQQAIEPSRASEKIRQVQEKLATMDLIQVDRRMGMSPEVPIHCRLYVPKDYARIAYMWHNMLFPSSSAQEPDFISVYVPEWPETLIFCDVEQGYTYILGSDYPGEAKKSMLRQAMYWIKRKGGLGLHAGSKILRVNGPDGKLRDVGFLLFGLSGTGKTTLTLHDHGLREPEKAIIKQDDVVLLSADGRAFGTEDGFYIKTEGLEPSQTVLWGAATHPTAAYENIKVSENGKVDFLDTSLTSNGRGVVLRRFIKGTGDGIDLEKANKIVFITRRNDIVPVCARLTSEQAAAYFMLGESIETSAGDPDEGRPGQARGRDQPLHRRTRGGGGQPDSAHPAREPRHARLHPEHRVDRGEGRIGGREDHDQDLDRDHEADRQGRNPLGKGPRLGLRGSERGPGNRPREVRPAPALLTLGIRGPRRQAPGRAKAVAGEVSGARSGDSKGGRVNPRRGNAASTPGPSKARARRRKNHRGGETPRRRRGRAKRGPDVERITAAGKRRVERITRRGNAASTPGPSKARARRRKNHRGGETPRRRPHLSSRAQRGIPLTPRRGSERDPSSRCFSG